MGAVDVAIDLTRVHAEAKKVARAAAQAAYQASITAPLNARDEALAALVDVEGFPLSTVKEILGTKDHRTARGAVEHGRELRAAKNIDPQTDPQSEIQGERQAETVTAPKFRYRPLDSVLVANLAGCWGDYSSALWHSESELQSAKEWEFHYDQVSDALTPEKADDESTWQEPTVVAVMSAQGTAEALAFIRKDLKR